MESCSEILHKVMGGGKNSHSHHSHVGFNNKPTFKLGFVNKPIKMLGQHHHNASGKKAVYVL